MATILPSPTGKSKKALQYVKIDMTPMVDLGFLLITFFIFTTAMMQPTVTKLVMPKESHLPDKVYEKTLLTAIVDSDKVTVYEGAFDKAIAGKKIVQTNYNVQTGLGYYIRYKQKMLEASNEKDDLFVAIKPLASASYQDVMNAIDEMLINGVKRYGIINLSDEEKRFAAPFPASLISN